VLSFGRAPLLEEFEPFSVRLAPNIALGLDPFGPRARPIWRIRALRYDPLKSELARVLKHRCAIALKVFGVSDEVQPGARQQLGEHALGPDQALRRQQLEQLMLSLSNRGERDADLVGAKAVHQMRPPATGLFHQV
jgi:hypothetical protein